jgi:hypothetical protein
LTTILSTIRNRLTTSGGGYTNSLSPLQLLLLLLPLPAAKTSHNLCHSLNHHYTSSSTARPPPRQVAFLSSLSFSSSSSSSVHAWIIIHVLLFTLEQWAWIIIHVHYSCSEC